MGGREYRVLASAREPEDAFNRRIWLFRDLAEHQWIADLDHIRETVQDVAAQTRGPLLLANALVGQAWRLVSSGDAGLLAKDILDRATRSLNKTDITYERLASSLEVIKESHRESRLGPFSLRSALDALVQSLPVEDKVALTLDVPAQLPAIQADAERMALALRTIVGYLLSIRLPDEMVELRAWKNENSVSICATIKMRPATPSDGALALSASQAPTQQAEMAAGRVLTAATKIVASHGGRLSYHVTAHGPEVRIEELPASTKSQGTSQ